jgi:hypothetical protein
MVQQGRLTGTPGSRIDSMNTRAGIAFSNGFIPRPHPSQHPPFNYSFNPFARLALPSLT